jgi:hypothetical protein
MPAGQLDAISKLYRAIRAVSGATVIVDGSKFPAYGYILGLVADLDVATVQLVRDPRAVAFSWQRRDKRVLASRAGDVAMFQRRPTVSALDWVLQNVSVDVVGSLSNRRGRRLRYEDFVAQPAQVTAELVTMIGGGYVADKPSDGEPADLSEVHIFGNPGRFRTGNVPIKLDDEWRTSMPLTSRLLVTAITSPFLGRYGYRLIVRRHESG